MASLEEAIAQATKNDRACPILRTGTTYINYYQIAEEKVLDGNLLCH